MLNDLMQMGLLSCFLALSPRGVPALAIVYWAQLFSPYLLLGQTPICGSNCQSWDLQSSCLCSSDIMSAIILVTVLDVKVSDPELTNVA